MKPHSIPSAVPRHITPEQDRHIRRRTRIFCLTMAVVCFGTLLWRLFVLQVMDPDGFAARAADQQLRDTVIPAPRGEIYSADGTLLAASETRWTIGHRRGTWRMIWSSLPPRRSAKFWRLIMKKHWQLSPTVPPTTACSNGGWTKPPPTRCAAGCAEHGAEGIQIRQDTKRIYPEGDFMGVLWDLPTWTMQGYGGWNWNMTSC